MKITTWILAATIALAGCRGVEKLTGTQTKKQDDPPKAFNVVACCEDNDGHNNLSWPAFLPQSHIDLCRRVHTACYNADCQIDGNTWLDMGVDCERDYKIGSQYYKGHGY